MHIVRYRANAQTPQEKGGVQTMAENMQGLEADFKYSDFLTKSAPDGLKSICTTDQRGEWHRMAGAIFAPAFPKGNLTLCIMGTLGGPILTRNSSS